MSKGFEIPIEFLFHNTYYTVFNTYFIPILSSRLFLHKYITSTLNFSNLELYGISIHRAYR